MFIKRHLRWLSLNLIIVLLSQSSIAEANNEVPGKPVHLVTINENSTFIINKEAIRETLLTDNVSNRKVVVVSIAGAFKEGKSFLLGFFLRYLNITYNSDHKQNNPFWLGDEREPLRGFAFKTSRKRTTTGIQMWSEPFLTTLPNGEKVAILLLDTQGLFDGSTPYAVNVKIFGLTALISSVQMFNIMQRIQEDKLQLLKFVTDYGSVVAKTPGNTNKPSFQKFIFLIRDWANYDETPYGFKGGQIYLDEILETTNLQHEELKLVRKQIKSCFTDISCFLMPYPGEKVVKSPKFTGQLSDVEEEFKNYLRELIQSTLSSKNLVMKEINGETVTVSELVAFLGRYVDALNSKETLEPKSIINANAEMSYQKALKAALEDYVRKMKSLVENSETVIEPNKLLEKSAEYRANAIKLFNNHTKLQDPKLDASSLTELQNKIDELYSSFREEVDQRREIFNLKNNVAIKNREIADLGKTNREMMNNLKTFLESNTATKEEVKKMQEQLNESQQKIKSLSDVRGEYQRVIARLEKDIEDRRKRGFWRQIGDAFGHLFG